LRLRKSSLLGSSSSAACEIAVTDIPTTQATVEDVAHLSLELGRFLLENGADTRQVQLTVAQFAQAYGYEARLLVGYDALLLTVIGTDNFRTKIGPHLQAISVNMTAVEVLQRIADDAAAGTLDISSARTRLDAVARAVPVYPWWLVAATLGLTAAGLSKLFGGDWPVFLTVYIAAAIGTMVRLQLGKWKVHPWALAFLAALVSGTLGGIGITLFPSLTPALCLIAPGMILVPGVPLINGIRDAISNRMDLSLARLAFGLLYVVAIACGLVVATRLTGVRIPVADAAPLLPVGLDAVFSALATVGYVFLFNVRSRLWWACVLCGLCSHTLRTVLMHLGLDIVSGTLVGSMAAGVLAVLFARKFGTPPATVAFPGVVALVPGSYAFRAIVAILQIMKDGGNSSHNLLANAAALVITAMLLTGAIALGVAIPLSIPLHKSWGSRE
jgi:uncharacterized membrane protein YjjP (DUF1212 family)